MFRHIQLPKLRRVLTIAIAIPLRFMDSFMFSRAEMLLAKTLTAVDAKPIAATKTASSAGYEFDLVAAAGVLTIIPDAFVVYFVRNHIAKGFALGGSKGGGPWGWNGWPGAWSTAGFFIGVFAVIALMGVLEWRFPGGAGKRGIRVCVARAVTASSYPAGCRFHPPGLARADGNADVGRACGRDPVDGACLLAGAAVAGHG